MGDLHMKNTSLEESFNNSNTSETTVLVDYIIIGVGLPLILVAIYGLYCQVRNDHVAPIYVINLLITDLIQICCLIVEVTTPKDWNIVSKTEEFIHSFSVKASVGFMVCVALVRYLVVAWPLWYRFRRTIKTSVVVCVVVWVFSFLFHLTFYFLVDVVVYPTVSAIFCLLPLPLLVFFLGGTLGALSAGAVPSGGGRGVVGVLVLVLLVCTLLFMPRIIAFLSQEARENLTFKYLYRVLLRLSPLADLMLYVFMRKGIIDKLLASVCCCRMDSNDISRSSGNDDNIHTVSSV